MLLEKKLSEPMAFRVKGARRLTQHAGGDAPKAKVMHLLRAESFDIIVRHTEPDWQEGAIAAAWQALTSLHECAMRG
jgi:hypothetical protein